MATERDLDDGIGAESVVYRAGPGTVLVTRTAAVLLGPEVEVSFAVGLWNGVRSSSSLQDLVDAVIAIGLRNLPSLGVVYRSGTEVRLLLRGTVRAKVTSAGEGAETVSAVRAVTWLERAVPGPVELLLDDRADAGALLPLVEGMCAAGSVAVPWTAPASGVDAAEVGGMWMPVETRPENDTGLPDPSETDVLSTLMISDFPERDGGPGAPDSEVYLDSGSVGPGPASTALVPGVHALEPTDDDFEDLFGATRQPLPVERAAVRQLESDDGTDGSPGERSSDGAGGPVVPDEPPPDSQEPAATDKSGAAPTFAPPRAGGRVSSLVAPPQASTGGLIQEVPGMPPGPGAGGRAEPEEPAESDDRTSVVPVGSTAPGNGDLAGAHSLSVGSEDDPSNMTMTRAQLNRVMTQDGQAATLTGASVQGVWCPSGHPNPPAATNCRICGADLGEVDPVSMPRPLLGRLFFSNGTEVRLDRPVIVGRLPRAERVSGREVPQLITVPSPDKDISRNHLEVRIDGWHVLVVDLESTNGTVVTIPGQPPERLRGGEEQPIVPGTVVTIADEVTFVYEATG